MKAIDITRDIEWEWWDDKGRGYYKPDLQIPLLEVAGYDRVKFYNNWATCKAGRAMACDALYVIEDDSMENFKVVRINPIDYRLCPLRKQGCNQCEKEGKRGVTLPA